ncbi:hypothetical protein MRB53_003460 [Persea americana]|uniref:Uncharacterized protein n=1 Tax=Persea americana TaxID=3435 RepID=A0ACC2MXD5_PERAE|nr:hypothetical protein MRB53_003460 [Persea americana]|eukprot:TRINITY_DN13933_c0_g2_i2.p1 TRINITY_DN13933_c0_g2~~TRINITY_DN13933_c0_g2_i2.p1  ORF type:complete len:845 (+),score=139.96 TRINITY_DN13933_c0_g2_i2:259-2793(+)
MTPGYLTGMPDDRSLEKQMEKQMGCMAGFRQLFDRHQILAGKRLHSSKRLPPPTAVDSSPQSEKFVPSPTSSRESQQRKHQSQSPVEFTKPPIGDDARETKGSPAPEVRSTPPATPPPAETPTRTPLPRPVFEFKDGFSSSWKLREAPRLSLDSRAIVDGKGSVFPREIRTNAAIFAAANRGISSQAEEENEKQRRSPSVVARLMGLEALPGSSCDEPPKNAELRRSASESRASRDLLQYRYLDGNGFQNKLLLLQSQKLPSLGTVRCNAIRDNAFMDGRSKGSKMPDPVEIHCRTSKCELAKDPMAAASSRWNVRKSFFDSQDFFPEPRRTGSLYGEIEKRLKMRGIDEPAKDLETLKPILEAMQLKGLLHSKKTEQLISERRNFIYDRQFGSGESPIVVMKPARSPFLIIRKTENEPSIPNSRSKPGTRRNFVAEPLPPVRQRRDRFEIDRNPQTERRSRNPKPSDAIECGGAKSPSSLARRKALSVETQKKKGKDSNDRRSSSSISPKNGQKQFSSGSDLSSNRSPRIRKQMAEISPKDRISAQTEDESSTISESSISASSQTDCEVQRTKMEDYKEGRSLLERCDQLLHSIAEITSATDQQPSPVSVLDSSLYKEGSPPSPIMKQRCIDFNDQSAEVKEDWSPEISPVQSLMHEEESDDIEFFYISEILSHKREEEGPDLFAILEKLHFTKRKNSSSSCSSYSPKASRLHRRLVFDTVREILNRKQQLSSWKAFVRSRSASSIIIFDQQALARQVWSELVKIRERPPAQDALDAACGVFARDMDGCDGMDGWGDRSVEMSAVVLDIERLVFKDLVVEAIHDMASFAGKFTASAPRRKLAF